MKEVHRPATATQVREILGPADEDLILRVLETEASAPEVVEALNWINADDQLGQALQRQPSGRVAKLCEILTADQEDEPEA